MKNYAMSTWLFSELPISRADGELNYVGVPLPTLCYEAFDHIKPNYVVTLILGTIYNEQLN